MSNYDFRTNIASLKIIGFIKKGRLWQRIEEIHREKGYRLSEIRSCLKKANLDELACWGDIRKMTSQNRTRGRVWLVARRMKK
jgi:hypothetical protein